MSVIKVRLGCFETNSSIYHALIVALESDSERWEDDNHLYIYSGDEWDVAWTFKNLSKEERPVSMRLYAEDEVFAFITKNSGKTKEEILADMDDEYDGEVAAMLDGAYDFVNYERWGDDEYYHKEYSYVSPSGERFKIYTKYGE